MSDIILAVDLGGTRCRAGIASIDDPAAVRLAGAWPAPRTLDEFVALIGRQLEESRAARLGLAIPGLAEHAACLWVPNLPYLDGLDLASRFPGIKLALGNDAHFAMLAEASAGAAADLENALLLAVGTGIGSAVLADGRIVQGARGGACSFGWAAADLADPEDGRSGWLELHSSGRALDRIAAGMRLRDGADLIDAARAGNPRALAAVGPPMLALGVALAGAAALLAPEAIIFAGGVADALDLLGPLIQSALVRRLPPHMRGVDLRPARFGSRASLVGAAFAAARGEEWRRT
ncbi:MAG TPA: ROK family protein [Roseiarcus sp.]|jgi:glucokinase|nr:ROK family protein [Roseiarcus sp.]